MGQLDSLGRLRRPRRKIFTRRAFAKKCVRPNAPPSIHTQSVRAQLLSLLSFLKKLTFFEWRPRPYCLLSARGMKLDRNAGFEHWAMLPRDSGESSGLSPCLDPGIPQAGQIRTHILQIHGKMCVFSKATTEELLLSLTMTGPNGPIRSCTPRS